MDVELYSNFHSNAPTNINSCSKSFGWFPTQYQRNLYLFFWKNSLYEIIILMEKLSLFSDCFPSLILHNVNLIVPLSINQLAETEGHQTKVTPSIIEIDILQQSI